MRLSTFVALCFLVAGFCLRAEDQQLRYRIALLSNAESAVPSPPGAAGSERSFLLCHRRGDWTRFNWPMFRAVPGLRELTFQARREAEGPATMQVRLLRQDGVEWQTPAIELGTEWQEHRFTAADFRYFRGGNPEEAGTLDFAQVVQFQVVPASAGEGLAWLRLDEIRFLPDGPAYTADGDELLPQLPPEEIDRQRLEDLIGRWRYEQDKLARDTAHAGEWLAELERLRADDAAARERLAAGQAPWQRSLPSLLPPSDYRLSPEDYARRLAAFGERPIGRIDLTGPGVEAVQTSLYDAVPPPPPTVETEDGKRILRQTGRFTEARTQQTIFLNTTLPEPVSVAGRMLEIDLRCPPGPLNGRYPFMVRLYTRHADNLESWADMLPDASFDGSWQSLRFDPNNPTRATRYEPTAVVGISFRFENEPGQARELVLDVGEVRLAWPPAQDVLRERLIEQELAAVHRARLGLYQLRDRIAVAEDELAKQPAAWRRYLASFQYQPSPAPAGQARLVSGGPLAGERFDWTFAPHRGGVAVTVRLRGGAAAEQLAGEVWDGATLLAGGAVAADGELILPLPPTATWSTRRPAACTLRLAALSGERTVARFEETVRPGVVTVAPGPASPVLRHLRQSRQPDWTMRENGRAWFPRMACYNWDNIDRTVLQGHRMFDDLWVDGLRRYGFDNQQKSWDGRDRLGVPFLHAMAPGYRSLKGWGDVPSLREELGGLLALVAEHANRPFQAVLQSGNEVELAIWGATLSESFPGALYQPLDLGTEMLARQYARRSPVMYVRASHYRSVPPLPHEDICGVNQYTGRYGGRQDEVARNLAELARESLFCNRPLMITEWMGPKYSWASTGIGGVTPRGAAYHLEGYWRSMIQTPGIVGSSEFTLNWVIAPFEDLTNQTREEAWRNRPRHQPFGGGRTADHVPLVGPGEAERNTTYRAMQAFHGPLYLIANMPGDVTILHGARNREAAAELGKALVQLRKRARLVSLESDAWAEAGGHWLVLLHPDDPAPGQALADLETALPEPAEPLIRHQLFPGDPGRLLVHLSAASAEAYARGEQRLLDAATALVELNEAEGAMSRIVSLVDPGLRRVYESYVLEFAARGYAFSGDDTRTELDPAEFLDAGGGRRPAWERLSAVILDTTRELTAGEWQLLETLQMQGVHFVVSLPCWQANPRLQTAYPATVGAAHAMGETFAVIPQLRQPVAIPQLGGADMDVIRRFQPRLADSPALAMHEINAPGTRALATTAGGAPVAVAWARGPAMVFLLGCPIGTLAEIHGRVTRSGETHPLYDRDTACGLERVSFFVVNACRFGQPEREARPRLFADLVPETTLVPDGQPVRAEVRLTDANGRPVPGGQLRARTRRVVDGRSETLTEYVDLVETAPGVFRVDCPPGERDGAGLRYLPSPSRAEARLHLVSLQFKAFAPGFIPADAALSVALGTP